MGLKGRTGVFESVTHALISIPKLDLDELALVCQCPVSVPQEKSCDFFAHFPKLRSVTEG